MTRIALFVVAIVLAAWGAAGLLTIPAKDRYGFTWLCALINMVLGIALAATVIFH